MICRKTTYMDITRKEKNAYIFLNVYTQKMKWETLKKCAGFDDTLKISLFLLKYFKYFHISLEKEWEKLIFCLYIF